MKNIKRAFSFITFIVVMAICIILIKTNTIQLEMVSIKWRLLKNTGLTMYRVSKDNHTSTGLTNHNKDNLTFTGLTNHNKDNHTSTGLTNHNKDNRTSTGLINHNKENRTSTGLINHNKDNRTSTGLINHNKDNRTSTGLTNYNKDNRTSTGLTNYNKDNRTSTGLINHNKDNGTSTGLTNYNKDNGTSTGLTNYNKDNGTSTGLTNYNKVEWNTTIKHNLTLVTAYWDLGTFRKGYSNHFTKQLYMTWATVFKYITNPFVVFTDSEEFRKLMEKLRAEFQNRTIILKVNKSSLWPFELVEQIRSVYRQPKYPKHHPNTVLPAYSCAQHAKYATVALTIKKKYFDTPFYAWLDLGYFRDLVHDKHYFTLHAPSNLDKNKLAMNRVYNFRANISTKGIIYGNVVWVGGGFFVGTKEIILKFEELYRKAVQYFLNEKLMSTDQQIIYALYSEEGRKALKPDVELQLYHPKGNGNPWFYFGFYCRSVV